MPNESVVLDAAASNIDGTDPGSPLIIGPGTPYGLNGWDYPAAPQTVLYASSVDTEGELPASARDGNRTITLKFKFVDPTGSLLTALQAKFGKFRREGGTLKRTMKNGDVRIYDVVAGDGWVPVYDFDYYVANVTVVEMVLPARPYSRGAAVDLGDNVETTLGALIYTDTGVLGDAPGLGRLVIDEDQTQPQGFVLWGMESRYYSSATTAALFFEAEGRSATGSGALAVGPTGAVGGGSNTVKFTQATSGGVWQEAMTTQTTGGGAQLTHIGRFGIWARIYDSSTTGTSGQIRFAWTQGDLLTTVTNDSVTLATVRRGDWQWVYLGQVRLDKAVTGNQQWRGAVSVNLPVVADVLYIDSLMVVPLEQSGWIMGASASDPAIASGQSVQVGWNGVFRKASNGGWGRSTYEGDYLLIPPAGAEARTVRFIVKAMRLGFSGLVYDPIDDISARLFVIPRYLT
jgi:hypothetical protein